MKTITRLFVPLLLAAIPLSGCEAVLNSLVNEPLFSAGEEWYDGQTYQLVKLSACTYEFEEDSEYVTLKENSEGKMIATLKMWDDIFGLGQESSVTITARNADDPEVEPYTVEVRLKPWRLAIYDKDNNIVDKMTAGEEYTITMVTGLRNPIPVVLTGGGLTVDDNPQSLSWDLASGAGILKAGDEAATTLKVTASSVGKGKVKATLGHRTVELAVEVAPDTSKEFVITPAKDSEWAGGAIQISASREVASWSHEMVIPEGKDEADYSESSSLSTSISESGLVTLGMYWNRFAAKGFNPTTMTLRITAKSVDGETATCEVASMGWAARFYLCSDEEVRNPEKVAVGDIVCLKFTDPGNDITDEEFLKDVKVIADNGQVKLTPVKSEGNHFQYKVEKTTGGKITLQLGIKASYGAYTEEVYSVSVSQ